MASDRPTVDELTARISAAIMSGELPVGSWLRQQALADQYGVSRQPVREALRQLQAAGVLEVHRHRGAFVRGPSPRDIQEAYLVRAELEGLAAELAAQRVDAAQRERLQAAAERVRTAALDALPERGASDERAAADWAVANDAFHETILELADVHVLAESIHGLHRIVPRNLTWTAIRTPRLLEDNARQHSAIAAAIDAGDASAAREAMRAHVRRSGDLIAASLEERQREAGIGGGIPALP